jgi:hypothetical protein
MISRSQITAALNQLEQDIKSLEIAYEQYFMGIEKREPMRERQRISRLLRNLINRYIPQVDLRFRLQGISSRFQSYSGHWDRVLRLIDEGRYERHTSRTQRQAGVSAGMPAPPPLDPVESLYEKLAEAHQACGMKAPPKDQVARFLDKQQEVIHQKFGDRIVEFDVVTENGKPKIKVRAKS